MWNFPRRWKKIMPLSLLHKGRRKWMGRREISGTSRRTGGRKMQERRRPVQARRRRRAQRVWEAAPYRHPGPQERAATWGRPYKNAETCPMNAVGADDFGGSLRGLCDSRAHPHPPRMRSAPSPWKGEGLGGAGGAPLREFRKRRAAVVAPYRDEERRQNTPRGKHKVKRRQEKHP